MATQAYTSVHNRRNYEPFIDNDRLPSAIFFPEENATAGYDSHNIQNDFTELSHLSAETQPGQRYYCLPLLGVSIEVDVYQTVSRASLKQIFRNDSTAPIVEATYSFPLYDGSVVVGFECEIGNARLLQGQVKPSHEAEQIYRKEVAEQRTAALLQEHTPEIFEVYLGNIPPRTSVTIELTYLNELKAEIGGKGLLLTIPTSIAPRYGQPPPAYSASTIQSNLHGLAITVNIHLPVPVRKLESTTHPISVETGLKEAPIAVRSFGELVAGSAFAENDARHARATLSDTKAVLGRDFVLTIFASDGSLLRSQAILESTQYLDGDAALMVSLYPQELFGNDLADDKFSGEILFLADRSGSMDPKMDSLRRAMDLFLRSLPHTCRFNIVSFGSSVSTMWPTSKQWTEESLESAIRYVKSDFHADMGGTEILSALKHLVESRTKEGVESTQVITVTDGEVWESDKVKSFVAETRQNLKDKIRFFALGLGDEVSHQLIQGIASAGCGIGQVLATTGQSLLNETVIRMLEGALMPATWDCEIGFEDCETEPPTKSSEEEHTPVLQNLTNELPPLMQAPFRGLCLHPFARYSVFYLMSPNFAVLPQTIVVKAKNSSGHVVTSKLPVIDKGRRHSVVRELAAKAIMMDLQDGSSWLHSALGSNDRSNNGPESLEVQKVAEQLGSQYGIIGKWTSFVAIDRSSGQPNTVRLYKAKQKQMEILMQPPQFDSKKVDGRRPIRLEMGGLYGECDSDDDSDLNYAIQTSSYLSSLSRKGCSMRTSDSYEFPTTVKASHSFGKFKSSEKVFDMREAGGRSPAMTPQRFRCVSAPGFTWMNGNNVSPWSSHPMSSDDMTIFDNLVGVQLSSGAFDLDEDLRKNVVQAFGSTKDEPLKEISHAIASDRKTSSTDGNEVLVLDTVIAILYLMIECASQEKEWKFIVRHALNWLAQHGVDDQTIPRLAEIIATP